MMHKEPNLKIDAYLLQNSAKNITTDNGWLVIKCHILHTSVWQQYTSTVTLNPDDEVIDGVMCDAGGMTCSHNGDVGLKWLQLSHRVTGGSGSEASAVNNAPDVHRWLQIRPVWISGIRFDSFSSQPSKRATCTVQGHTGRCRGPCVEQI